jgi:hypothetical protein
MHRDIQARKPWYDILATFGDYKDGKMELPNLGIQLEYNPGTIVGLAGKVVQHGVAHCTGNRVCLAYYMRDTVHKRARIKAPGWMNGSVYDRKPLDTVEICQFTPDYDTLEQVQCMLSRLVHS